MTGSDIGRRFFDGCLVSRDELAGGRLGIHSGDAVVCGAASSRHSDRNKCGSTRSFARFGSIFLFGMHVT
jgi:hypothetical protein